MRVVTVDAMLSIIVCKIYNYVFVRVGSMELNICLFVIIVYL